MNKRLGFIGCGNMANAMISGIIRSGIVKKDEIVASDASQTCLKRAEEDLGIHTVSDNKAAAACKTVVLAVKPQYYAQVITEIAPVISEETVVVTIAPGITVKMLEDYFGHPVKLVRTMPNTPALVGEGMTGVCRNSLVTDEELSDVCALLEAFGRVQSLPEKLMDTVVSVSGSAPAYVFMFIEAMADAAVSDGMPREQAYEFAAQAVLGSAKMVLETGKHPGALKDMVCSPGGTTIEAVRTLEAKGFRNAVFEAMKACTAKSREFSEK